MAYNTIESSVDDGSPINLFEFRYGDGGDDVFRYTNNHEQVVAAGRIWSPFNITHGPIVTSGSLDKAELPVNMPSDIPLAALFLVTPPSRQVLLSIWRGHALANGYDDFVRIWTGRVISPTWHESEIELSCEPVATSLKRIGLRRYYQYGCAHYLYGDICRVDKEAHTAYGVVTNIVDTQTFDVQVSLTPTAFDPARLVAGTFRYDPASGLKALRTITSATPITGGYRITLMSAIVNLQVGKDFSMSYGCKHNWDGCLQFNNTPNYGGFPNIPTKNPYRTNTF
jgi:hypothetical protein